MSKTDIAKPPRRRNFWNPEPDMYEKIRISQVIHDCIRRDADGALESMIEGSIPEPGHGRFEHFGYAFYRMAMNCIRVYAAHGATLNDAPPGKYHHSSTVRCPIVAGFVDRNYCSVEEYFQAFVDMGLSISGWRINDDIMENALDANDQDLCIYLLSNCDTSNVTNAAMLAGETGSLDAMKKVFLDADEEKRALILRPSSTAERITFPTLLELVREGENAKRKIQKSDLAVIQFLLDAGTDIDFNCVVESVGKVITIRDILRCDSVYSKGLIVPEKSPEAKLGSTNLCDVAV